MPRPELEQGNLDQARIQELVSKMQSNYPTAIKASCNAIDELYQWADDSFKNYQENYNKLTEFVDCFVELYKCSKNVNEFTRIKVELQSRNKLTGVTDRETNTVDVFFKQVMDQLSEKKEMTGIHKMLRNRLLESFGKPDGINSEETELYNNILNDITGRHLKDSLNKAFETKTDNNQVSDYKRMIMVSIGDRTRKSYLFENSYVLYSSWVNDKDQETKNNTKKNKIDSPYLGFYIKSAQSYMHLSKDKKNNAENINEYNKIKREQKDFIQRRYYNELENIKDKEQELSTAQSKVADLEEELSTFSRGAKGATISVHETIIENFKMGFAEEEYDKKFVRYSQKLQADLVKLDGTNGTRKGERYRDMERQLRYLRDNKDVLATLLNKGAKDFLEVTNPAKADMMIKELKNVSNSVDEYIRYKHDAGTYKFFNFVGKKRYSAAQDIKIQLDGMIESLSKLDKAKTGPNGGMSDPYKSMISLAKTRSEMAECSNKIDEAKKAVDAINGSINASKKHLAMYDSLVEKNDLGEIEKQLQVEKYQKAENLSYGNTFKMKATDIALKLSGIDQEMNKNYYFNEAYEEFLSSITKAGNIENLGFDSKVAENDMNDKISNANMNYVKDVVASVTIMNMISRHGKEILGKTLEYCQQSKMDYKSLKEEVLNNKNVKAELDKMTYGDLYGLMHNEGRISKLSDSAVSDVTQNMVKKLVDIADQNISITKKEQLVANKEINKEIRAEAKAKVVMAAGH